IFTISLDFELYWGMLDKLPLEQYRSNLLGVPMAVEELLRLFTAHGVHATWATVGFLFLRDRDELLASFPTVLPDYFNPALCPYRYAKTQPALEPPVHFAPDLIARIRREPGQELGTHTFSHFYCLEAGATREAFQSDLTSATTIAKRNSIEIRS